jgi:hypothetical protein
MDMRRELRGGYSGPAEILLGDEKLGDVTARLHSWVNMLPDDGLVKGPDVEGTKGWAGSISGLGEEARSRMVGEVFTIRVPDGREARALLRNGQLLGSGPPPFDP